MFLPRPYRIASDDKSGKTNPKEVMNAKIMKFTIPDKCNKCRTITINKDGHILILDKHSEKIYKMISSNIVLSERIGDCLDIVGCKRSMIIDKDGTIFILSCGDDRIYRITDDEKLLLPLYTRRIKDSKTIKTHVDICSPCHLSISHKGCMLITEDNMIFQFCTNGETVLRYESDLYDISESIADSNGNIYFSHNNSEGSDIKKVTGIDTCDTILTIASFTDSPWPGIRNLLMTENDNIIYSLYIEHGFQDREYSLIELCTLKGRRYLIRESEDEKINLMAEDSLGIIITCTHSNFTEESYLKMIYYDVSWKQAFHNRFPEPIAKSIKAFMMLVDRIKTNKHQCPSFAEVPYDVIYIILGFISTHDWWTDFKYVINMK